MRYRYFVLKFSIQMYVILSNFVYNKIIVIIARKEHILHKENKLSKFLIVINCNKYEKRVYFISSKAFCIANDGNWDAILKEYIKDKTETDVTLPQLNKSGGPS